MKIEVSNGELLDRISILEIKKLNMQDPENLANVELEFLTLNPGVVDLFTKNVFPDLINHLGLTLVADTATMENNQRIWIAQQRYHNAQHRCTAWVLDILEDRNTETPCQTIIDEAYVQHCLREQGYEIRCNGLDVFPATSKDLREIIYENSNISRWRFFFKKV